MQTRRGRRGTWKCRVSKYRVLFLFIRWRDAKLLGLLLSSLFEPESFLLSNNEIFSFFFFSLLTHPACTKKQKEIFKGIRARKLYSSAAIPSKNVCTNICRGKQILFRRCVVVAFTRNVQSRYAAVPFKVVSRKTQDCRNMKHGFCL